MVNFPPESVATFAGIRKKVLQLADTLQELGNSKESTKLKYILSKLIISGSTYDKGKIPYQDFDLLIKLRNNIIHCKPVELTKEPPKFLTDLQSRKLVGEFIAGVDSSWLSQVCTRQTARWACNTASNMILDIRKSIESAPIQNKPIQSMLNAISKGYEPV